MGPSTIIGMLLPPIVFIESVVNSEDIVVERDDVSREGVASEKDEFDTEIFLWRPRAFLGSGSSATGEREIVGVVSPVGIESTSSRFVSSSNPCFAVDSGGDGGRASKAGEYRLIVLDETGLR